jgi:glutathionylspermidine synthase
VDLVDDMKLIPVKPLTKEFLESVNFSWHTHPNQDAFLKEEIVSISEKEAHAYYEAANELYDMFVEAGEYVIENDLFHELNIPFNLVEIIKASWENDVHWHLYGRFDFAGGLDGEPIKLLEFNADTPTSLIETSIAQWALLKYNHLDNEKQFNNLYNALRENFQRLVTLEEDTSKFEAYYDGWKILFSSVRGAQEDEDTTRYLETIAKEAGFNTAFCYVDEVEFDAQEGIFYHDEPYEFWFKLLPWEDIAIEEGELATLLTEIIANKKAIILNPAYTLMFQSKAIMKILWDLFPNHPLLLETSFEPLQGRAYVEKKAFGREGENVTIYDKDGTIIDQKEGEYDNYTSIYQEMATLNRDEKGDYYQAGVFFAYEGCGLGFRTAKRPILEDGASFAGHLIEE